MQTEIDKAIRMRAQAKALEDEAANLKEGANDILTALMPVLGLKTSTLEGVGTVTRSISKGSSINRLKLIENLLDLNLDPDVITDTIQKSSSDWEKEVIKFVRAKV